MKWVKLVFEDRTRYNQAGKVLISEDPSLVDLHDAFDAVSNWRAAHRYPLHAIMMGLRTRAKSVDTSAIVVQRSKRLMSIIPKLRKFRLTQIQDIGGCRAVLKDLSRLSKVHSMYMRKDDEDAHRSFMDGQPDNYIVNPKPDGYRSIHYVYRYRSDHEEYQCFDGMKIEVQLRTAAQHSWATALEIVDLFTGQKLKTDVDTNQADPQWKRFFKLMGSLIALNEDCPTVLGTPSVKKELVDELRDVCESLDAISRLEGYGSTVRHIENKELAKRPGSFVVILDTNKRLLRVRTYRGKRAQNLEQDYLQLERGTFDEPHIHVVQVDAASLSQLKRAYPNFDLDTKEFVRTVKQALGI